MRNLIRNTTVIFLFLISWNNVLVAQGNADSIRVVNEALQMITFPEPEFEKPYASNLNPKEIADLGFEQPNLGNNAPTTNQNLDLENNFIKTHLSRGLGLRMLNEFGIHKYDSLKVVFYNLPEQMPLRSYSYRSMQASFPNDYKEALRSIDKPMLVIIGSDDEAFIAKEYPPVFETWSNGKCYIIEGETHNGIRHNAEAMEKVRNWAVKNQLR